MNGSTEDQPPEHRLKLRNLKRSDYEDIRVIMAQVYDKMGGAWDLHEFTSQLSRFPEGQICIEDHGRVIAAAISMIVDYRRWGDRHTYNQITGDGFLTTHDPNGDTLYGVDMFVHPDYRDMRLGRRLYDARKELCENLNLRAIVFGGRIPGYSEHAHEMTPQRYVARVKNQEIHDPILTFQLANDFHVRRILTGYMPDDQESRAYAILLEWINIYYEETEQLIGGPSTEIRIGAVQWKMRSLGSVEELIDHVEYFVDAVGDYKADVILFPELFNGPLLARYDQKNPAQAMRSLADHTEEISQELVRLAVAYNINIIAGSMPECDDKSLYNVARLCRRDGTMDKQYKLHITEDEQSYWGFRGGPDLRVFNIDGTRIGILICYDVEFPELARLLADKGMDILFVPYWTDTRNAYTRVRHCAQARAIENECYVVMTGSVGNLPKVENLDIHYSQAAVFTPSDFAFPQNAVTAEASPNTEMTLIADLDLDNLKELRMHGNVRNRHDRRLDIYSLDWVRYPRD